MLIRPYTLTAWLFLTAGIILGAWWSYMELGWGGYWAWDPVENASLVPWLLATAFLHTAMLERSRQILPRANILLAGLAFSATLAATWLTRGGAVASLHSFGQSPVSAPLFLAMLLSLCLAITAATAARPPRPAGQPAATRTLPAPFSRDGLICLGVWLLLALAAIILAATLTPAVSGLWSAQPIGLTPTFYNRVCPPLFVALTALIFAAFLREPHGPFPWLRALLWLAVLGIPLSLLIGPAKPLSTLAIVFSLAVATLGFTCLPRIWSTTARCHLNPAVYALHLGFAIMVLAVAASGPHKLEATATLAPGEQARLGDYTFTLREITQADDTFGRRLIDTAHLNITGANGKPAGSLAPSLVLHYKTHRVTATHEAAVLPSLSRDIYAALIASREDGKATLSLSIHPLIDWLWLGGALMCLAAALRLARHRSYRHGRP